MKTNILVQYEGGGYDGCIWEWNFFYIDKDGNFENIFASGVGGIGDAEIAKELVETGHNSFTSQIYVYSLDSAADLDELAKETNSVLVAGIVKWFNNYNVPGVQPYAICSECGVHIEDHDEIALENWHGCGGIMSTADALLCRECRNIGSCSYCGEYYGDDREWIWTVDKMESEYDLPKGIAERIDEHWGPLCEYCCDTLLKEELDRAIKRMQQK